jgi:hypothetical protein
MGWDSIGPPTCLSNLLIKRPVSFLESASRGHKGHTFSVDSAHLEDRRLWDNTGLLMLISRLCPFKMSYNFLDSAYLEDRRWWDSIGLLVLISRLCPFKGLTIFWILHTWRTGDGGTALVYSC